MSKIADLPVTRNEGHHQNIKALVNHRYGYRLRVGRYRILFDVDNVVNIIAIQEVKKRNERTY